MVGGETKQAFEGIVQRTVKTVHDDTNLNSTKPLDLAHIIEMIILVPEH